MEKPIMSNNEYYLRIMNLNGKLEALKKNQFLLRIGGIILVFVILFGSIFELCDGFVWILSLLVVIALIIFMIFNINKQKKIETEIYFLSSRDLENRKKLASLRGEWLPDAYDNYEVKPPKEAINLPISYFPLLIIVEIIIGILTLGKPS